MSYCGKWMQWARYTDDPVCPHNIKAPYALWELTDLLVLTPYPPYIPEILAPATAKTYEAAIKNGADAIYFGYGNLNARAGADNIDTPELLNEVVSLCREYGAKAYLTLNTMLKNTDIYSARKVVKLAEEAKIDAFIISDFALVPMIRKYSKAAIHASTQMGIHNMSGAAFAYFLGIDRAVLSREVTQRNISDILHNVDIELETFVHGALCAGFSGACLFSSMLTGKSGNRGRCMQLCRQKFICKLNGEKIDEGYLLSAKDICMADRLDELADLRINSLKIEGRLKSSSYVEGVTAIYKGLAQGDFPYDEALQDKLKAYFNRGNFAHGYWDGADIIYKYAPNHIGVFYGKVEKVISKNLILISTKRQIDEDDCFRVVRKNKDIGGIMATGETKLFRNTVCYVCYAPCEAQIGDDVFLTKMAQPFDEPRKVLAEVAVRLVAGEPAVVKAVCRDVPYEYTGDIVEKAISEPISQHDVIVAFLRTGDTNFEFLFAEIIVDNAFVTKKALNDLRRNVIAFYRHKFIDEHERPAPIVRKNKLKPVYTKSIRGDFVELNHKRQLTDKIKSRFRNIVFAPRICDWETCLDFYNEAKTAKNLIFIKFPIVIPTEHEPIAYKIMHKYDGVLATNIGNYYMALYCRKLIVTGWTMNVANRNNILKRYSNQIVASVEMNSKELSKHPDWLVYTYGRLTLMYLNFCPLRLRYGSCDHCKDVKTLSYSDAKGEYPIISRHIGSYCEHELKNSVITNLGTLTNGHPRYFDFVGMKPEEIDMVLRKYYSSNPCDTAEFNHLHLNRGVE